MAPNAFDDQYIDCADAMEQRIITEGLLQKELSGNIQLRQKWESATIQWARKKKSGTLPPLPQGFKDEYGVALITYTGAGIYKEFNAAVRVSGQSRAYYMTNFHFKSLHFYLTRAIQLLKDRCNTQARIVYRGVRGLQFSPPKGSNKKMRFGQFTSTSLDRRAAEGYGTTSFFTIRTSHGASIQDCSSFPDEAEVLIPPYEEFTVTNTEQGNRFVLNSTQKACSKYNCAYLNGRYLRDAVCLSVRNSILCLCADA
ncbi:ecto-ADP-ribosyltransferase 5-like [Lissotriton helveticus]